MITIPEGEPTSIVAGDLVQWYRTDLSDYPATEYTLTYYFFNTARSFSVTAAANGSGYLVTIATTTSDDYTAGDYKWDAYVSKTGERRKVDSGYITIKANTGALSNNAGYNYSSTVKTTFDAIEAVITGRASKDQEEFTIQGRSLKRTPIADLLKLRNFYYAQWQQELQAEAIELGDQPSGKIRVRFVEPK